MALVSKGRRADWKKESDFWPLRSPADTGSSSADGQERRHQSPRFHPSCERWSVQDPSLFRSYHGLEGVVPSPGPSPPQTFHQIFSIPPKPEGHDPDSLPLLHLFHHSFMLPLTSPLVCSPLVCFLSAWGRPAICLFKFRCNCHCGLPRTPPRTHTRHIKGETNYLNTGKLFCLVHPCVCLLPRSHPQMGYLMKSALPVPICVRNEFLHFSKSENLQ